jgi:phage terminase large subunit
MGFDQKGNVVLKICRAQGNRWDVQEEGVEKPLASFDDEADAVRYANDLARTKDGTRVEQGG